MRGRVDYTDPLSGMAAREIFDALMGSDVAPRKDFIRENARFAEISV